MSNNNQAICATLEIKDLYSESKNTLHDLFMLQKDIQEKIDTYKSSGINDIIEKFKLFEGQRSKLMKELSEVRKGL